MKFNPVEFLDSAGIPYKSKGANVPRNAVNINCIYCNESKQHLVVNTDRPFVKCWVCKAYATYVQFVMDISKCSTTDAQQIVYGNRSSLIELAFEIEEEVEQRARVCNLPEGTFPIITENDPLALQSSAIKYLVNRSISADNNNLHYGEYGEQAYRVVIPMYFGGQLVTYTGRDFSGRSSLRYKTCKTENCVLKPTEILYGFDEFEGDTGMLVEGPIDRLAMRSNAFLGVSTSDLSPKQKKLILELDLKVLCVILDPGMETVAEELGSYFVPIIDIVKVVVLEGGDPAKLGYKKVMQQITETKSFDF